MLNESKCPTTSLQQLSLRNLYYNMILACEGQQTGQLPVNIAHTEKPCVLPLKALRAVAWN
jgi:hypothetical protein